jgi:hypothetical protein
MRMRRPKDRQVKHAGQLYVIDIATVASDEFDILAPAERLADIGRWLLCISHCGLPLALSELDLYMIYIILYGPQRDLVKQHRKQYASIAFRHD